MNPPLFGYRLRYYLLRPWKIVSALRQNLMYYHQRATRGWAVCDTWHGDYYIATVIAGICAHLVEHTSGIPYPFFTQENGEAAYTAYIKELASAFSDYAAFMGGDDECLEDTGNVHYDKLIERMKPLFDHFSTISD